MIVNHEAERSILGNVLVSPELWNEAARTIRPEDFSLDSHRRIYARMAAIAETGESIDLVTLVSALDRHRELEPIGGLPYLSDLPTGRLGTASAVRSSATVGKAVRRGAEAAIRR